MRILDVRPGFACAPSTTAAQPGRHSGPTDATGNILVILFWAAVLCLPRAGFFITDPDSALGRLRFEDLLAPALALYTLRRANTLKGITGRPAVIGIGAWAAYLTVGFLYGWYRGEYPVVAGIVFTVKEIEYLLYALFFAVTAGRSPRLALVAPIVASTPILLYSGWQIMSGRYLGFYGLRFPFEAGTLAAAEVGGTASLLFIYTLSWAVADNRSAPGKKLCFASAPVRLALAGAFAFITTFTLSRSNIAGAAVGGMVVVLRTISHRTARLRAVIILALLCLCGTIAAQMPLYTDLLLRFGQTHSAVYVRAGNWQSLIDYQLTRGQSDPGVIISGLGLGSPNYLVPEGSKGLTLGVDNQYVRRFFEVGILGTALWIAVLGFLSARVFRLSRYEPDRELLRGATVGLLIAMAVASAALELFQLVGVASLYYALLGTLLGLAKSGRWRRSMFQRVFISDLASEGQSPSGNYQTESSVICSQ